MSSSHRGSRGLTPSPLQTLARDCAWSLRGASKASVEPTPRAQRRRRRANFGGGLGSCKRRLGSVARVGCGFSLDLRNGLSGVCRQKSGQPVKAARRAIVSGRQYPSSSSSRISSGVRIRQSPTIKAASVCSSGFLIAASLLQRIASRCRPPIG